MMWAKIDYTVDVNPPNPVVPEKTFCMAGGDLELAQLVEETIADLLTDPRVGNVATTLKGPIYFLLDKTNLNLMLQAPGLSAMQLIDQGSPPPGFVFSGPNDTPRDGWTDDDGVKRVPPPSEKAFAAKSQAKTGTKIVKGINFVDSLRVLAGQMVLAGFPTGRGTLLAQLFAVITASIKDPSQSSSDPKVIALIDRIDLAIKSGRVS